MLDGEFLVDCKLGLGGWVEEESKIRNCLVMIRMRDDVSSQSTGPTGGLEA
jgi:hypothetical protein